jgi:hypothetical protein
MTLTEMFEDNYTNPKDDHSVPTLNDVRKTKLTLGQINRMRLIRDVRKFELRTNLEKVRKQYGPSPEAAAGPGF